VLACGLGLSSAAHATPQGAATADYVLASTGSVWTPKQPAASQPEAVPSATSPTETPIPSAQFQEGWLLPLGGGLAGLAALSVLMVAWSRNDSDDD
jgi:hypothetical protein